MLDYHMLYQTTTCYMNMNIMISSAGEKWNGPASGRQPPLGGGPRSRGRVAGEILSGDAVIVNSTSVCIRSITIVSTSITIIILTITINLAGAGAANVLVGAGSPRPS